MGHDRRARDSSAWPGQSGDVLVNLNTEFLGDDQRDSWTAKAWISTFQFDDSVDKVFGRPLGTGLRSCFRREQARYFQRTRR